MNHIYHKFQFLKKCYEGLEVMYTVQSISPLVPGVH